MEAAPARGTVVFIGSEGMGRGDDELGAILMEAFLDTLSQFKGEISHAVFVNAGARLAVEGSPVLEQVRQLEEVGVDVMVCGTCLNHFGIADQLAVGSVSNMYAIIEMLSKAERVIGHERHEERQAHRRGQGGWLSEQASSGGPGGRARRPARDRSPRPAGRSGQRRRRGRFPGQGRPGPDPDRGFFHADRRRPEDLRSHRGGQLPERCLRDGRGAVDGDEHRLFPRKTLDLEVLREVLIGGQEVMTEAGALLVGGHSVNDPELKYGLSVTGTVHPDRS